MAQTDSDNILLITQLQHVEQTNPALVAVLTQKIKNDGYFTDPIIVDRYTNIILNGHHRTEACRSLKLRYIPVVYVDYQGLITLTTPEGNKKVTKRALLKGLQPFKTVNFPELDQTVERVKIPLTKLR